jgi:uncharacterized membrane protein YfcA
LALVVYAGFTLMARQLSVPSRLEPWLSPLVDAATGVVTGSTGVFVIPAVPYLQALGLRKDDLIQALGLSFTVSTIALAPALAGMWLGQVVRHNVSPERFRRWFLVCLLLLGIELVLKSALQA